MKTPRAGGGKGHNMAIENEASPANGDKPKKRGKAKETQLERLNRKAARSAGKAKEPKKIPLAKWMQAVPDEAFDGENFCNQILATWMKKFLSKGVNPHSAGFAKALPNLSTFIRVVLGEKARRAKARNNN